VDFGGGPLTSASGQDVFLAKFSPSGGHLWSRRFGVAGGSTARCTSVDASGGVLVTGSFSGTVDFGGGPLTSVGTQDVFLAKLDAGGGHLWSKRFGTAGALDAESVAVDASNNVLLTGFLSGSADFGGGPRTSVSAQDVFIAKLSPSGGHLWSRRFGATGDQVGQSLATDAAGNVLITGYFSGTVDFGGGPLTSAGGAQVYVVKLDPGGTHQWSKSFGEQVQAQSLAVDASGNVLVTGVFDGSIDFGGQTLTSLGGGDVFIAELDPAGAHKWSVRFGDSHGQVGQSIAADGMGHVLVAGDMSGSVNFGGGTLTSAGASDVFVAKFLEQ
jgi:hypothetical protein